MMELTDNELISQYLHGETKAFKYLIERYSSALYNFAVRLGASNDAADIVQDIFIKVWQNLKKFNSAKASFKTWIYTIARNTITDYLRKKKPALFSQLDSEDDTPSFEDSIEDTALLPDEVLEKAEDSAFLNSLIGGLSVNYRTVLSLYYDEEMTFDEIGKVLGKPLNTVKSQHRRALLELKKLAKSHMHQSK